MVELTGKIVWNLHQFTWTPVGKSKCCTVSVQVLVSWSFIWIPVRVLGSSKPNISDLAYTLKFFPDGEVFQFRVWLNKLSSSCSTKCLSIKPVQLFFKKCKIMISLGFRISPGPGNALKYFNVCLWLQLHRFATVCVNYIHIYNYSKNIQNFLHKKV